MSEITSIAISEHEKQVNDLKNQLLEYKQREIEYKSIDAEKYAELNLQVNLAKRFVDSKAFPNMSPEQAFVILQAGKEMGLQPMESIQKLYIVNGAIGFHGKGLVSELTSKGVEFSYENETDNEVTVKAIYQGKEYSERVTDKDQILTKSKAMTFAKKNKMRFHGVRMIANFYLSHLCGSVGIWDQDDLEASKELQKGDDFHSIKELLIECKDKETLDKILAEHNVKITKDIELCMELGKTKKRLGL